VTTPKLQRSWGGKIEAQAARGVAKPKLRRASGSTWGRSGTLGRFWGDFEQVLGGPGGSGEGPREISVFCFFVFIFSISEE